MRFLRLFFLVACTVVIGTPIYIAVVNLCGIVGREPWMMVALVGSYVGAWCFGLRVWRRPAEIRQQVAKEILKEMGLLEVEEFKARRAFGIEEFEDEGPSYFVELEDGRVLFLNGQYLWDFEETTKEPARFPCGHFKVKRDLQNGGIFDLELSSPYLKPDAVFSPFTTKDFEMDWMPEDGAVLKGSYAEWMLRIEGRG